MIITRRNALAHTLRAGAGLLAAGSTLAARAAGPDWRGPALEKKFAPGVKLPPSGGTTAVPQIIGFTERPYITRGQLGEWMKDTIIGVGLFAIEGRGLGGGSNPGNFADFGKVYITSPQLLPRYRGRYELDVSTWDPVRITGYVGTLEVPRGHSGATLVVEMRSGQRLTHPVYVSPWPEKS